MGNHDGVTHAHGEAGTDHSWSSGKHGEQPRGLRRRDMSDRVC
jgi:hypothetical protein